MSVVLEDVRKVFADPERPERAVTAVDGISLEIRDGEMVTLLGPSGCGKTTALRIIAGFETPTSGRILIAGEDVSHLPPHARNTAMVFQSYAIFPHLSVAGNVAFGLEMRGLPKGKIASRVAEILNLVELAGLEHRSPEQLSGGQQQRVALARAIITGPRVLLFDEPLSNRGAWPRAGPTGSASRFADACWSRRRPRAPGTHLQVGTRPRAGPPAEVGCGPARPRRPWCDRRRFASRRCFPAPIPCSLERSGGSSTWGPPRSMRSTGRARRSWP